MELFSFLNNHIYPGSRTKVQVIQFLGAQITKSVDFRSGKVPKAFKIIPGLEHWEKILELTKSKSRVHGSLNFHQFHGV